MGKPLVKHLTPLGKKGSVTTHRGKGSQQTDTSQPLGFQSNMNDYAKASPSAPPMDTPGLPSDFG